MGNPLGVRFPEYTQAGLISIEHTIGDQLSLDPPPNHLI